MRQSRTLAAVIALFMSVSLSLVGVSAASASSGSTTAQTDSSQVAQQAKKRKISVKFKANGAKSFSLSGRVTPAGGNLKVVLLRATTEDGNYKVQRNAKTNGQGNYTFSGLNKEGFYVIGTPASKGYKAAVSKATQVCKGGC